MGEKYEKKNCAGPDENGACCAIAERTTAVQKKTDGACFEPGTYET